MTYQRTAAVKLNQQPLGGPILTKPFLAALLVFLVSVPLIVWRFSAGLGPSTALSDGHPWGIWIAFDVVTGTALASGGFAVALLVFILNRWRYHPLVRPAMTTAALGYSIAMFSLIVDVGRPWNLWKVPFFWGDWNVHSPLLEVAVCIAAYLVVLWIEVSPAFLERMEQSPRPGVRRFATRATDLLYRVLPWLIALGVLLPMMHQSSLGTLMVLTGAKLHPLWQTPILPLLFIISSFAMGLGAVIVESMLANYFFARPLETAMLRRLARVGATALGVFVAVRYADLLVRGQLGAALGLDARSLLLLAETAVFVLGLAMLLSRRRAKDPGQLMRAAIAVAVAGCFYRFNSFVVAFDPGPGWSYFPSVPEILITVGLIALEIMAYLFLVQRFPVLRGLKPAAAKSQGE